jgi:hypothetical protein
MFLIRSLLWEQEVVRQGGSPRPSSNNQNSELGDFLIRCFFMVTIYGAYMEQNQNH